MLTGSCSYPLRPGLSRAQALLEIRATIPVFRGRAGLVRRCICIDIEAGRGCGTCLWENRSAADATFAEVVPIVRRQLGAEPPVNFFDTPVIVDNGAGTVHIED